tara:strand:+ start:2718 stop:6176 length:3459 start_codon:yes stop_codon:yes gene_type:complete
MARVQAYSKDASLDERDKLLGSSFISTSSGADVFQTGNFTLGDLAQFFANYNESEGSVYNLTTFDQSISTNATNIGNNATYSTTLAGNFGTFDANGNLATLSEAFANQVFTTTTNANFATSSYATNLASTFGTFDASGNLTALSEAFANQVFTTTSNTNFATSSALTALESTVTTQGVTIGGLSTSIATANSNITTNSTGISANSTATTNLTAVVELKPLTFRQDNPPALTEPIGSIWFDTNDNNKIYILTAGTPNVWSPTFDGRVAVNTTAISTANQTISANTTAHEANASSITNLSSTVTANKTEQDNLPAIFRQDDEPATTHPLNSLWYDTNDGNKLYVMITTAGTKSWSPTQDLGLNTLISGNATSIGNNATGISNNSTAISNNLASIGLTPKVFRQNDAPALTEPVSSIWYDTNDSNKPYVLVAGSPNVWTVTVDPRMGATVQGLANAVSDISTNSNTISASALKREELEAVFAFDSSSPAQVTGVAGALNTSINNAASSAVQATANSLDKLEAVFTQAANGDVTGITGSLSTAVTTHAGTAITNASLAAAADVTELETQFSFNGSGDITGVADTLNTVINTAQSDAESASATKIDSLAANFFTGYDNADGTFTDVSVSEAFADEVIDATASARFATTTSQNTLAARVGVNEGAITTNETVAARADGFVKSSYGVTANANGVITGMQIVAANNTTSSISEVKFQADKFIINTSTTSLTPFSISGNKIQINGNLNVAGTAEIKGSSNTGQFIACDFKNTGSSGLSSIRVLNNTNYYGIFRLNTTVENDIGYYGIDLVIGPATGGGEKKLVNFNGGGISMGLYGTKIFFNDGFAGNSTSTGTGAIGVRGSSDGQATQAMFVTVPTNQATSTPAFAIETNASASIFKVFKNAHVETGSIQTSGNISAATINSSGTIIATGAMTSNSSVTATNFIDKNDANYYLNPNSTSNLNAITLTGNIIGQNAYFGQDVGIGFTSGSIGGRFNVKNNAAGQIAAKLQLGASVNSASTGVFVNTTAAYNASGMFLHFQSNHISGDDNVLIAYLDGDIVNKNNSYTQYSDQSLKENIVDATPKLEEIKQIRVRNFNFIGEDLKQIGVVAQELESIFPALVKEREVPGHDDPIKTVKYSVLVPILIKAIQELEARVATLEG